MKKNLFYLFALICSMSLFTACSDDDDENWKKVPSQIITAENLELETNIPTSSDASVKLAMTDAQNGILTLNKVVRGADEIEINVTVVEQTDGTFKFQGEKSVTPATKAAWVLLSSTNVKVSGTITLEGKAAVTVSTEFVGDIVKKYQLCDAVYYAGSIVASYAEEINITMDQMIMAGMGQLPSTDGIVWKSSPANLAYWYVKGEHIYVVLNIPAIVTEALKDAEDSQVTPEAILQIIEMVKSMSGADIKNLLGQLLAGLEDDNMLKKLDISKISDSDIEKLISYVIDGFPLNYRTTQLEIKNEEELVRTVNDLSIYLDKDLFDIFMPALYPMLPDVDMLLKNTNIEFWGQSIPLWNMIQRLTALNSMTEIEGIWNVTTRFNLGISLGDNSYKK